MSDSRELEGGRKLAIKMGDYEYIVVPQRIGRIRAELPKALAGMEDFEASDFDGLLDLLGDRAHGVLKVFIPDLMPPWEFQGFPTKETMEAGDYNEEYDKSPDPGQIRDAFTAASTVSRMDFLGSLGKLIGPDLIRAFVAGLMRQTLEAREQTDSSESLSVTSGDTPSTSSGTNGQTLDESRASLTPVS